MSKSTFFEGLRVKYNIHVGHVKFISDEYMTLCINSNPDPMRDVCILVYANQWKNIELLSGNRNSDEDK